MTFNEKEFHALIDDDHTVVNMTTNDAGNGNYVIVMNAFVRPTSALRDNYLNPHRNMGRIPVQYVRACPKCDTEWKPLMTSRKVRCNQHIIIVALTLFVHRLTTSLWRAVRKLIYYIANKIP